MNENVGSYVFNSNFDSGNLAKVEKSKKGENEFNLWTLPDCANTPFENGNRTWFYFSVSGPANTTIKFNLMNLNRQAKLYSQGMRPLYRVLPHQKQWERIKEKPLYTMDDQVFTLSFKFTMPSEDNSTVYFAFCYPYSYSELQQDLDSLDRQFSLKSGNIYYKRDLLCHSLEKRRVDIVTVTCKGDENLPEKPVVFVSARVHPGETPSSFVLKGFLDFILKVDDIRAQKLREKFLFKIVPMLNPDGVYRGHYRTDSRGVNLNRVYLETHPEWHPTISAVKNLILSLSKEEVFTETNSLSSLEQQVKENLVVQAEDSSCQDDSVTHWPNSFAGSDVANRRTNFSGLKFKEDAETVPSTSSILCNESLECAEEADVSAQNFDVGSPSVVAENVSAKSRLFAYIDLHGHASKRGIFIYGNHFKDAKRQIDCLLLPKLISINSQHFDFWACNFTERNMYLKDKRDGLSKEGSGRVAVYKLTGIVWSYTLECNYNTGRMRNVLNPMPSEKFSLFHSTTNSDDGKEEADHFDEPLNRRRRTVSAGSNAAESFLPAVPYTEESFQEVGEAVAVSLLDLIGANPLSRLKQSVYGDLEGVRQWIRVHCFGQRRFQFVEADFDDESAVSNLIPSFADRPRQVAKVECSDLKETVLNRDPSVPSATAIGCRSKNEKGRYRLRVPWPSSCKHKESPNQSPKQVVVASEFVAAGSTFHFPKQQKSTPNLRRLPRKKSLKKAKVVLKKDVVDTSEVESEVAPTSPPKILKRKRLKSRSSVVGEAKEKRKFKVSSLATEKIVDVDDCEASTSSAKIKSPLVKKKKMIKKRNAATVLKKKKRSVLSEQKIG